MDRLQRLLWLTSFAGAFLLAYGLILYWEGRRQARIRARSMGTQVSRVFIGREEASPLRKRVLDFLHSSGRWALRGGKSEASSAREALTQAGFRHPQALSIYYGIRLLGALLLPIPYLSAILIQRKLTLGNLGVFILLAGAGFYLPYYILLVMIRKRQDRLDKALPEVLDLFIICMEAGLALQATINRVAEEIRAMSRDFYSELQLVSAELRTGLPREVALQNLGQRTGVQSVRSLVALMIQSEKMGTSIADALRIHADFVREKRILKAEEMAGKLAVKILFPLFFFIFPAIFIVILGPAAINLSKGFFK